MDRHDIGAGGWQPGLLPESASSNRWRRRRDAGLEEMQGNGWGPGAGGKAFGRHRDGAREAAAGELQEEHHAGQASTTHQGPRLKDGKASSSTEETLQLQDQHLKKKRV